MSDEKIILQSMELFPTVLESIIIGYVTRKKITFQPFNDNKGITISEDGCMLSIKELKGSFHAAISSTPLSQCRLRWKIEMLSEHFHGYFGVAFPSCRSMTDYSDIVGADCVFFTFLTNRNGKIISLHGNDCLYSNKSLVMEVDLIQSSVCLCVEESDQMIQIADTKKHIVGKFPIYKISNNVFRLFLYILEH